MTTIIAGNFEQQDDAKAAVSELARAGFTADETTSFFVDPPVGHKPPLSSPGDLHADGPTKGAISGAAIGGVAGAAVGLATLPILGPGAAVAGAGVGAYVGSLGGAMAKLDQDSTPKVREGAKENPDGQSVRQAGTLVGVVAVATTRQEVAIAILQTHGAFDIDRSEGTIVEGQWKDFDRSAPLQRVA